MAQREHTRISFDVQDRPRLYLEDSRHAVLDCSETGVRFSTSRDPSPEIGTRVTGQIRFARGNEVAIEGVVVWILRDAAALRLMPPGIPSRVLEEEKRQAGGGRFGSGRY